MVFGDAAPSPFYRTRRLSVQARIFDNTRPKVNDLDGNPIEVAAIVVYAHATWRTRRSASMTGQGGVLYRDEERKAQMGASLLVVLCASARCGRSSVQAATEDRRC